MSISFGFFQQWCSTIFDVGLQNLPTLVVNTIGAIICKLEEYHSTVNWTPSGFLSQVSYSESQKDNQKSS